ncbi:hypothetical protein LWI28_017855 [Acer negundo]|uniref:Uncharacterized protein n=1 Tax=Acer negundo TaxID=4023 RepID=A0AAD5IMX7_ACENE|nr:hypothetical protein LWI28_017855 [Acer negundo]
MKKDLKKNAIDRFLSSDEGYERDNEIFDQSVEDLKEKREKPTGDPVEDLSVKFSEVYISDDDPGDVSEDDERFLEDERRGKSSVAEYISLVLFCDCFYFCGMSQYF